MGAAAVKVAAGTGGVKAEVVNNRGLEQPMLGTVAELPMAVLGVDAADDAEARQLNPLGVVPLLVSRGVLPLTAPLKVAFDADNELCICTEGGITRAQALNRGGKIRTFESADGSVTGLRVRVRAAAVGTAAGTPVDCIEGNQADDDGEVVRACPASKEAWVAVDIGENLWIITAASLVAPMHEQLILGGFDGGGNPTAGSRIGHCTDADRDAPMRSSPPQPVDTDEPTLRARRATWPTFNSASLAASVGIKVVEAPYDVDIAASLPTHTNDPKKPTLRALGDGPCTTHVEFETVSRPVNTFTESNQCEGTCGMSCGNGGPPAGMGNVGLPGVRGISAPGDTVVADGGEVMPTPPTEGNATVLSSLGTASSGGGGESSRGNTGSVVALVAVLGTAIADEPPCTLR